MIVIQIKLELKQFFNKKKSKQVLKNQSNRHKQNSTLKSTCDPFQKYI